MLTSVYRLLRNVFDPATEGGPSVKRSTVSKKPKSASAYTLRLERKMIRLS